MLHSEFVAELTIHGVMDAELMPDTYFYFVFLFRNITIVMVMGT